MNMLAIILLQAECVLDLSIIRAFPQDAIQNMNYSKTKLTMPVLAMGGGYIPVLGGNITMPSIIYGMQQLAQNVQGIKVPNAGHFIPEEWLDFVVKSLGADCK